MRKCLCLLMAMAIVLPFLRAQSAADYIREADKFRGSENWSFDLRIVDFEEGADAKVAQISDSTFKVVGQVFAGSTERVFKSVCQFLSPESDRGKKMLMDGQIYWMFFPETKNLVRITPAQRLAGQATAADIASVNFENDYNGEIVGEETILKDVACVKLKLTQKGENVAYDTLLYWIDKASNRPIKVEYYGPAGKLLKTGYYRDFHAAMGKMQSHELFLLDPVQKGRVTKLVQSNKTEVKMQEYVYRKEGFATTDLVNLGEPDAMAILAAADRYRGADSWGFELQILELQSEGDKKPEMLSKTNFAVASRIFGQYPDHSCKTFVEFTAPASEIGKKMLMEGQIYWMYFPDTKNLVRITPQQRISGLASAADIAAVNFTADYNATLAGEEEVLKKDCFKLKLSPKNENVAYASLIYWVEKDSFQPVKVDYFSVTGTLMKTAYFRNFKQAPGLGGIKAHELFIIDPLKQGYVTRMLYSNLRSENRADYFFRKDGFATLSLKQAETDVTALQAMQNADKYRGGENWGFDLDITDYQESADKKVEVLGENQFIVTSRSFKADNNDMMIKCLCKFTKPETSVGQKMLMDGQIYWMYFPATKNIVRITPAQRLSGQATAADIASTNFTYDYTGEFAETKEEVVLGQACYKLVLTAKTDKEVAYQKLFYWIEKESFRPVKVEYFTVTEKHLKTAYYRDFKEAPALGQIRAHELFIVDPVNQGHITRMRYKNMRVEESPEYMFRKDGLDK